MDSPLVIQVTKTAVVVAEYDMALGQYTRLGSPWTPGQVQDGHGWAGREIVAAGLNPSQFVVALNSARLVVLNLNEKDGINVVRLLCV